MVLKKPLLILFMSNHFLLAPSFQFLECCAAENSWNHDCNNDPGSSDWYIDWASVKCLKDCAVGVDPECGGFAATWKTLYGSKAACCDAEVSWNANCYDSATEIR